MGPKGTPTITCAVSAELHGEGLVPATRQKNYPRISVTGGRGVAGPSRVCIGGDIHLRLMYFLGVRKSADKSTWASKTRKNSVFQKDQ